MSPKFAEIIRAEAERESLQVRVMNGDVFETMDGVRRDYQLIILAEVVPDFRTTGELRGIFELAADCLAAGRTAGVQRLPGARRTTPRTMRRSNSDNSATP